MSFAKLSSFCSFKEAGTAHCFYCSKPQSAVHVYDACVCCLWYDSIWVHRRDSGHLLCFRRTDKMKTNEMGCTTLRKQVLPAAGETYIPIITNLYPSCTEEKIWNKADCDYSENKTYNPQNNNNNKQTNNNEKQKQKKKKKKKRPPNLLVCFISAPWPVRSSGGYEGQFSGDPVPVFSTGGRCEQFWHRQWCPPLFHVVHPTFALPIISTVPLRTVFGCFFLAFCMLYFHRGNLRSEQSLGGSSFRHRRYLTAGPK